MIIDLSDLSDPNEEFEVERPVQGPFILRGFAGHRWAFDGGTECLDGQASLRCLDPCSIPYCYHTRRLCPCEWAGNGESLDFNIEDLLVTAEHVDWSSPSYYDPDGDPGWIKLTPAEPAAIVAIIEEERRIARTEHWWIYDRLLERIRDERDKLGRTSDV